MSKKVELIRRKYGLMSTLSEVWIDGVFLCHALEDAVRADGVKIKGFTALPAGKGRLVKRYSPSFKRELWCITNQPDNVTYRVKGVSFTYAMFHGGNNHDHTHGCPLIAKNLISTNIATDYNEDAKAEFQIQGSAESILAEALREAEVHQIEIKNWV